jgi:hypothetical protein
MKSQHWLFVMFILWGVSSCEKDNTSQKLNKRVKSYTTSKGSCLLVEFIYDSEGRLTSRKSCDVEFTYQYFSDIIRFERLVNGVEDYHYIFTLNPDGTTSGYVRYQNGQITSKWAFEYDANKFRTLRINVDDTANYTVYTMSNNNVVEEKLFSTDDNEESTRLTDYFTDKSNSLSYVNYGTTFFGASSKKLKRREVLITPQGTAEFGYSYEYDAYGYVTKLTTMVPGIDTVVTRYTYQ